METSVLQIDTALSSQVVKNNGNSFDFTYLFKNTHRAVYEFSLRSVQLPVCFYNIRSPYNTITINSTTYTITPGEYTSSTLIAALNTLLGAVVTFSINTFTNRVGFVSISGTSTINISGVDIAYFLGFTNGQSNSSAVTPVYATNTYNLSHDLYVNILIDNFNTSSSEPMRKSFTIPINTSTGGVVQWSENGPPFTIKLKDSSYRIDRLVVKVFDRYGNVLDNNGVDWAFSLEIKSYT